MSAISPRACMLTLVMAVFALGAGAAVAQPRQAGGGITVFDGVNLQGATRTFNSDVPDLRRFNLNDRISSLQVSANESWEVCENDNYGGRCIVVSGVERDLRDVGMSDSVTSIRRVQSRQARVNHRNRNDGDVAGITVSDDVNFQGASLVFTSDVPDLRAYQLNDRISSLRVAFDESWQVCERNKYRGRCVVVSGAEGDLRALGLSDVISSMRRVDSRGGRDDRGGFIAQRQSRSEIVLFDQPGYRGMVLNETEAAAGLGAFSSRVRSAQILGGAWELCDEPGWGGRCVQIESSVPDLERIGLRGVASARPLDTPR